MTTPQVIIGLCNPKSPSNVGSVMRAVGCYGANEVRYTGERFNRAVKYHTDTQNTNNKIPLTNVDDLTIDVPENLKLVCVELVDGATSLPLFEHPRDAIYIFGPEDGSIEQRLIDRADYVVYVPTIGCMNLAASVNVLLYDRLAKSGVEHSDDIVILSRDANNRLSLKS